MHIIKKKHNDLSIRFLKKQIVGDSGAGAFLMDVIEMVIESRRTVSKVIRGFEKKEKTHFSNQNSGSLKTV